MSRSRSRSIRRGTSRSISRGRSRGRSKNRIKSLIFTCGGEKEHAQGGKHGQQAILWKNWIISQIISRLALFVASVSTDSAVFAATLPV